MFPKDLRLNPKAIPGVAKKGKKFESKLFNIKVWYDNELEFSKFAISISLKVDKRASVRNRIKRLFRSAIVELDKENFFRKGSYLILIKSAELKDLKTQDVVDLLAKTLD